MAEFDWLEPPTPKYIGDFLTHISGQLSDQAPSRQFSRWPRKVLLEYLCEGLYEIAAYRPEAFSIQGYIDLLPGSLQRYPDGIVITALLANEDGTPIIKNDFGLFQAFATYNICPPRIKFVNGKVQYKVRAYAIDSADDRNFYVSPPVPPGTAVKVLAAMNGRPKDYTEADWYKPLEMEVKYYNNLVDYIMARAYQRDTESQVSQNQARELFSLFYQAMGVKYKFDSARGSGYYKGEIGTGDSRAKV